MMLLQAMNNGWRHKAVGLLCCCLLFMAAHRCEAQGNLIPNHSFEEYDTCRVVNDVYYPDNGPLGWFSAAGTPDHMMSCLPYGSFNGVPLNAWSFQYPQDGECYAGMLTYREIPEIREYFMTELLEPLVAGQQYYASFYASVAWGGYLPSPQMWLYTNGVGMIFTTQPRQWQLNDPYPASLNYAHIYSQAIITDTAGWTLVSGSFVADSAYQYVMIGNPFDNASTDTLHIAHQTNLPRGGMLIDNVCVSANPSGCPMVVGIGEYGEEEVGLFPNPAQQWIVLSGIKSGAWLNVHDVSGRCVWQGRASGSRMQLDVGEWARGIYVLHMESAGAHKSFKFVLVE